MLPFRETLNPYTSGALRHGRETNGDPQYPHAPGPSAIRMQDATACDRLALSEPGILCPLAGAGGPWAAAKNKCTQGMDGCGGSVRAAQPPLPLRPELPSLPAACRPGQQAHASVRTQSPQDSILLTVSSGGPDLWFGKHDPRPACTRGSRLMSPSRH